MKQLLLGLIILSSLTNYAQEDSLKILSWNVFLRPAILKDGQLERVDSISAYLNRSDADVLVLQEVFHGKARKKLIANISNEYPYVTKAGPMSFWGISSGVLIASKDSIHLTKRISFRRGIGSDKMAKKGGIAASISHNGKNYNIIGTHLQAGKGKERESIRRSQMLRLKKLSASIKEMCNAPVIYAGDFNMPFKSENFELLIDSLDVSCAKPESDIQATSNFADSDLYPSNGKPKWIDFIFTEKNKGLETSNCVIEEPRARYRKDRKKERLSDHNPIISTVMLNDED